MLCLVLAAALACWMLFRSRRRHISGKRTLVVGGTSGLGLEVARLLHRQGNTVTITSRSLERARRAAEALCADGMSGTEPIGCLAFDVMGELGLDDAYDYVFYMPGFCKAGYLWSLCEADLSNQVDLNYLACARILLRLAKQRSDAAKSARTRRPPLVFALVSSTAALFPIPGYASYAPTKAALGMLARTARPELLAVGIDLRVFNAATMRTPGLVSEEATKPSFTREIEYTNTVASARAAASFFLSSISSRTVVAMDWFTHLATIRAECECFSDYLLFPVAVLVVFVSRSYVSWSLRGRQPFV